MLSTLFDLSGKRAFITGATKGIGRAIAEAFVDHGAVIALTSRHKQEADAAAAEINARAARDAASGFESDQSDRTRTLAAYEAASTLLGRIDILVCNAAAVPTVYGAAAATPIDEYTKLVEANFINTAALMNHAAVAMKERREGVILVTSSSAGVRPGYGTLPYGVSKAALNHWVRGLAGELAGHNVRVNAIAPGLTRSWSVEQETRKSPDAIDKFTKRVPLRRLIEPREIAAGMVFLASEGGKAITGQIISMDGGEWGPGLPWS